MVSYLLKLLFKKKQPEGLSLLQQDIKRLADICEQICATLLTKQIKKRL